MQYIVYLTINKVNFKTYIGVHKQEEEQFDYYLGCGVFSNKPSSYRYAKTPFQAAVAKYGPSKFYRITLRTFDSLEEALECEAMLVDEEWVSNSNTYNCSLGGGCPPKHNKPVYKYSLEGELITCFSSIRKAALKANCSEDTMTLYIKRKKSLNKYF